MTQPLDLDAIRDHAEAVRGHLHELGHPGPSDLAYADLLLLADRVLALLARLDAAEARAKQAREWGEKAVAERERAYAIAADADAERDAALARAVPDGHTRIDGTLYRAVLLDGNPTEGRYRLVPADTEEKP